MNNSALAMKWIKQSTDTASGSNFWFRDGVIYSFRTAIGEIMPDGVVILSPHTYSSYTSRHQRHMYNALRTQYNGRTITTPWQPERGEDTLVASESEFNHQVVELHRKMGVHKLMHDRARSEGSKNGWQRRITTTRDNLQAYADYFGYTYTPPTDDELQAHVAKQLQLEAEERVREKEREREYVTQPEVIDWLNFVLLRYGMGQIQNSGDVPNYWYRIGQLTQYGYLREDRLTKKAIKLLQEVSNEP